MERSSGIVMPVFSLPSPGGIGTLGRAAYEFIDFLAAAKQRWWQMLPLGPTGYGDSPYQSFSAFAGNPYFIDPEMLAADGLLTETELAQSNARGNPDRVDYGALFVHRRALLKTAALRALEKEPDALDAFTEENTWLPDYALFMALKEHFDMQPATAWPEDIRLRRPAALAHYRELLNIPIRIHCCQQMFFFRQWDALRAHAKKKGIRILGDVPIYAAPDSADVWAEPQFFLLDAKGFPCEVAGVPPDYFSEDGQFWGNPLYDWDAMHRDGFGWWIRRIGGAARLYDAIRIDHFRGFESYWAIPCGACSAKEGHWKKGPGMELIGVLNGWFRDLQFIAEDLGTLTPEVQQLLRDSGWPGMKVLQFAFNAAEPSSYLPHAHVPNALCYTGTHDNTTLADWRQTLSRKDLNFAKRYLGISAAAQLPEAVLRAGMSSVASLFLAPLPDWLGLGAQARINAPGTPDGNWQWRLPPGQLTPALAKRIAALTVLYGRAEN